MHKRRHDAHGVRDDVRKVGRGDLCFGEAGAVRQ
jgi:hypothetical protein